MKIKVKLGIFAIVFGVVLVNTKAVADEKSKTSNKSIVLAKAQQKAFETYISEQFTPFTEQEDWKVFVEIVTYYNNSPSKIINITAEKQQQFKNATRLLVHAVSNSEDEKAKFWLSNLKKTTHNINFIWSLNWDDLTPNEESLIEPINQLNGF